jgi:hypothetical protein
MNKNDPTKEISISAIGRTLSEANAARVRQIHNLAGKILDEAGLTETSFAQRVEANAAAIAAQEMGFADSLARSMWHNTMMEATHRVEQQFHHFCAHRDKGGLDLLLKEFTEVVRGLYDQSISLNIYLPLPDGERHPVFASEEEAEPESEEQVEPEVVEQVEPEEHSPEQGEIQLMCGVQSLPVVIEASGANYHPVRGVLFRIDEPSEAPPSVGTGKPLYVPRKVAEALLGKVNNLPLDADDSLSRHANEKIVGVMVKASIEGNDFIVEGHLWPWNNRAKVSLISANSRDLGMSMNAYAKGRNETVDGIGVFWIDELELLGANILFHEKATYKKTRFAAEATPEQEGETVAIAASSDKVLDDENFEDNEETHEAIEAEADNSDETYDSQTEEMDNHNIQLQLEAISRLLTDTVGKIGDEMAEIKAAIGETDNRVNSLLEEKTVEAQRIAASQQEESEKSKQQALIDSITQAVISSINPSRQPQRITSTPIAASGGAKAPAADALPRDVVELLCERSKLDAQIQASENDLTTQLALVDRKRDLNVHLAQLGYAGQ